MGNFRSNSRDGFRNRSGGSRFGQRQGGSRFGGRGGGSRSFSSDRKPAQMYDATCSNCGKPCQVPFRPMGTKPVLCSDCFRKTSGENSFAPRGNGQSSSGISSEQFAQLNTKLDKIIAILQELELDVSEDDEDEDFDDDEDTEDSEN